MLADSTILIKSASLLLHGLAAGALTFVSCTESTTVKILVKKDPEIVRKFFPIWWPAGRDLMAPLIVSSAVVHTFAALTDIPEEATPHWVGAGTMACVMAWTIFVMGGDIQSLMNGKPDKTEEIAYSFCNKHHLRTFAVVGSYGYLIYALLSR